MARAPTAGARVARRDLVLMTLTVSSGAVDAISYLALGKVFTAFMTGNVVFLGLGAADAFRPGGPNVLRVGVAIAAFAVGVFVATCIIQPVKGSRLWSPSVSRGLGCVLATQVGFLVGWAAVSGHPSSTFATWLALVAAFAMGIQSGAVASLAVSGVFTTAVTASVIFLSRDVVRPPAADGMERRRLAAILISLLAGALAGGLLLVHARTWAAVLPPAATLVAIVAARVTLEGPERTMERRFE